MTYRHATVFFRACLACALLAPLVAHSAGVTYSYDDQGRLKAVDYSDLKSTGYSLDAAGNRVNVVTQANAADVMPPTTPSALTATSITSTTVNLSWVAAVDNVAVAGYRVYRGGSVLGTSAATGYSDNTVSSSTAYNYTVRAYDAAGNQSGDSNVLNVTTPAPPLAIPAPPSPISKAGQTVIWTASSGATYYQLRIAVSLSVVYSGTATSFNTALPLCERESYNAVACNASGCSAPTANIGVLGPKNGVCP